MNYKMKSDSDKDLLSRLLKIRKIEDNPDLFLNPKLADYWLDPFLLNDMQIAVDRIIKAIKKKEKIMIFGDYDVDGITSSFILYSFLREYLNHEFVEIKYPNRQKDGYGLKTYHLDEIKDNEFDLVITVDNGITSIEEAKHAKKIGLDLIITDHHHALDEIPDALAVVNPQVSENYKFKGLAGVGVAFKVILAMLSKTSFDAKKKNQIFEYFLPVVAIGTVADVVPLVDENRVIVKKGLEIMNIWKNKMPKSLKGFLDYLNLKDDISTYHIGYVIGPRINAGGRIASPYDSLNTLLYTGDEQRKYLDKIDEINTARKKLQDDALKIAKDMLKLDENFLIAYSEDFHEGIIGIVSGRITEQNYKPSMVMSIQTEEKQAVASLRGPNYFNVIEMMKSAGNLLERFGGHKNAGGLTVKLENLEKLKEYFENYCRDKITEKDLERTVDIDTYISEKEWENDVLAKIDKLAPFGEGNPEPVFLLENVELVNVMKIGKNGNGHLKFQGKFAGKKLSAMFRGKGAEIEEYSKIKKTNLIGKIKKDTYNGGYFVDVIKFLDID